MRMTVAVVVGAGVILGLAPYGTAAAPAPEVVALWPASPPGEDGSIGEEKATRATDGRITGLTNISRPTITVHRPDPAKSNRLGVVVCPGGGYNMLAWDHEGEQVAAWLNSIGATAVLLKYRVPRRADTPKNAPPRQALMDAQRALSLTRARADEWGIDPDRLGILGFSAGGHLAAWTSTNDDKPAYEPVDDADQASRRPDFAVVIYPGGIVKRDSGAFASEIQVDGETPRMFIAMSNDDPVGPENAIQLYQALHRAKVPAELHIFATGGHGYGMRKSDNPASAWPQRCEEWLRNQGLLTRGDR